MTLLDATIKVVGSFPRTPHRHDVVRCTDDSFYRPVVYSGGQTRVLEVVNTGGLVEKVSRRKVVAGYQQTTNLPRG